MLTILFFKDNYNPTMIVMRSRTCTAMAIWWMWVVFETPPAVPKPPTIDQLYNHGTTAFPKRSETKNPRMEHNNFWAWTKVSGAVNKFPGKQISFRGWTKRLWERSKYLWGSSRISAHAYNFFGQPGKFSGHNYNIFGAFKILRDHQHNIWGK